MTEIDTHRQALRWAFDLLEHVMAGVEDDQAHWIPPGDADPIGTTYAHAICELDILVKMLTEKPVLFETSWQDRTGTSEPSLNQDNEWVQRMEINLPLARKYAHAVYQKADAALSELSPADFQRQIDLTAIGLGVQTIDWCLSALVTGHLHNMTGEISVLKGLQVMRGYPNEW